jgi:hypothetical protein
VAIDLGLVKQGACLRGGVVQLTSALGGTAVQDERPSLRWPPSESSRCRRTNSWMAGSGHRLTVA